MIDYSKVVICEVIMKNSLDLNTIINFVLQAKTKKSIKDYIYDNRQNYLGNILTDLIKTGDIEILKKIPSECLDFRSCMKVAVIFGDEGISYLPNMKNLRKKISHALLGKTLEVKCDPSSISYNYYDKRYYLEKYIFADGVKALNTSYEILSFRNIIDLYRANNFSLIGVNLINVPVPKSARKELDFTGAYVLRKDISLYPNAIAVDEIICSKKFHKNNKANNAITNLNFSVKYSLVSEDGKFNEYSRTEWFDTFTEFSKYLNNDLSNSDLRGYNLNGVNLEDFNLDNALYDDPNYYTSRNLLNILSSSSLELYNPESMLPALYNFDCFSDYFAYYISDLHLDHKINNLSLGYDYEIPMYIEKKVNELYTSINGSADEDEDDSDSYVYSNYSPLFILGDISSSYEINKCFLEVLSDKFKLKDIILVLGNHELWDSKYRVQLNKYKKLCKKLNIELLDNSMLVIKDGEYCASRLIRYSEDKLLKMSNTEIQKAVRNSRLIVFGGIGFAGLNKEFNATNGIYRDSLTRKEEIFESKKIEKLYKKLNKAIPSHQVVIASHMPKSDWSKEKNNKNWIYLHGHTHRNYFKNDLDDHIFADNQIGYKEKKFNLNHFNFCGRYDTLENYKDGIHKISALTYLNFNRGKNIDVNYNSDLPVIMIKKNGFYLFMNKYNNKYRILRGGTAKRADYDPDYYYTNMDEQVDIILKPYNKYSELQTKVSKYIQSIGGSGNIHGAIVDIDFYNHIYVYPNGKLIPYSAEDIINKEIYSDLSTLLEEQCPKLYLNYQSSLVPKLFQSSISLKKTYLDTDIYRVSNKMRSMQYLKECNVIREWTIQPKLIKSKKK